MKNRISLALILALVLALCTAPCLTVSAETADPAAAITEGYYVYDFYVEGYGQFTHFFRFYPEAPVLGAVFYAGFSNNRATFAGTYAVTKAEHPYALAKGRDEVVSGEITQGTAPYTVTFYSFSGEELASVAFDGDILYNDQKAIMSPGSDGVMYHHDTDGNASKYAETYAAEVGVKYLEFVSPEDETSTIQLNHNQTYLDLIMMMVEGTWTMTEGADGGYNYALTPNDPTDAAAVLSVSADKQTAVYTPAGGDPTDLVTTAKPGANLLYTMTGMQTIVAYGVDANLTLSLYDDGSAALEIELFGSKAVIDQGTYKMVNQYTFGFTFDNAGYIESAIDFATQVISLQYAGQVENLGTVDAALTLQK